MTESAHNVLFLCTGNSARSVFGECIVNRLGRGRFTGYCAGSQPKHAVHRLTLEILLRNIEIFLSLPLASLDRLKLQRALDEIGRTPLPEASPAQT